MLTNNLCESTFAFQAKRVHERSVPRILNTNGYGACTGLAAQRLSIYIASWSMVIGLVFQGKQHIVEECDWSCQCDAPNSFLLDQKPACSFIGITFKYGKCVSQVHSYAWLVLLGHYPTYVDQLRERMRHTARHKTISRHKKMLMIGYHRPLVLR